MVEKWPVKFSRNNATSTSLSGSLTCRKSETRERRLYFPSEGRYAEDFFVPKIRRLRPGLNPRTWVPEASMLTTRHLLVLQHGILPSKTEIVLVVTRELSHRPPSIETSCDSRSTQVRYLVDRVLLG
jgi:hypothetical protein